MEDGLWRTAQLEGLKEEESLNPYSNGRWSLTKQNHCKTTKPRIVLILILMEDGLWPSQDYYLLK